MGKLLKSKNAVSEVVVRDAAELELNTDPGRYARMGWIIVLLGVVGFVVWAMMAPLDKGVPVSGTVVVATNRKAVQHQMGGTIAEILVKEGDLVKEGQVLLRLNDMRTRSDAGISRTQYFSALATEARLTAEREGRKTIVFPKSLDEAKTDPRVVADISLQNQLIFSRQLALQNEMAAIEENIAGQKVALRGVEESRENKKLQRRLTKEQVDSMRELAADGYVARNRLLDLERTQAQIDGAIAEDSGNIGRTKRQIAEMELRRSQRQQEYQREVRTQLSEVQKEVNALRERLASQDFDQAGNDVKSPATGTVVGMAVFTKGAVVAGGFKMMDIVPAGDELEVEGSIPVHLIDKIHNGLPVDFIFSAFNQNSTPHIPGIVINVSPDRLTDERSGQPYYKMKARVTPAGLKLLAHNKVISGMPVEMFVKTGERTMMNYLLKPIFDRAKTSMTEE
jgi:protease secretion system membrane fusion protein